MVYPVAADKFRWTTREELDLSAVNIETEDGARQVWDALSKLQPPHCAANKNGDGCFDLIMGFTPARTKTYPNGRTQGYTMGLPGAVAVSTDEDVASMRSRITSGLVMRTTAVPSPATRIRHRMNSPEPISRRNNR
jgi:hypothetical protein